MALLLHTFPARSDDPAAAPSARGPGGGALGVSALIARWDLDPLDFQVRVHELCDGAGFAAGSSFVTVTNRRVRASRTYLSRLHPDDWLGEFEQDLCAGVFSGTRPAP